MSIRLAGWSRLVAISIGSAAALFAAASLAATIITKTSFAGNQTFDSTSDPHLLDLGEGHGTTLQIHAVVPSRLVILFNAECAVRGPDYSAWLNVDVLVDGVAAPSSDNDDALCTSNGDPTAFQDRWVTAARDTGVVVGPGDHTIQIRGQLGFGGPQQWWIGDLSLIVIAEEL